jgi:carnitine monooxygenase subunit
MNAAARPAQFADPRVDDSVGLPAWIYSDADFFELEKRTIFRTSWQLICHLSDIPQTGDYHCFDLLGESVVVVRSSDSVIRSFHNVCRHRASRLLDGQKGNCGGRITCPYHAWTYALDGRLIGVPQRETFRNFDASRHGLVEIEQDIFMGFIFVRLETGLPGVREMFGPYVDELAVYRMEDLVPPSISCRPNGNDCGPTSSCGRTSPSTSTRTRSISCSSCPSRRQRR